VKGLIFNSETEHYSIGKYQLIICGDKSARISTDLIDARGGAMAKNAFEITGTQRNALTRSINEYLGWLGTRTGAGAAHKYDRIQFARPSVADWIMKVDDRNRGLVWFNPEMMRRCSFQYFQLTVLHECFHLFVQDLPNKDDAKRLKDDFGDHFMKLLDIEADFYTALFYRESRGTGLIDLFQLYHEGSRFFGDPKTRTMKFERFIGSILSISKAYFDYPDKKTPGERVLYIPSLIPGEESMHVLVSKGSHYTVQEIQASSHDLEQLKKCYTNQQSSKTDYVSRLINFAAKALRQSIPERINDDLKTLMSKSHRSQPDQPKALRLLLSNGRC
jgi:hypothetical protein